MKHLKRLLLPLTILAIGLPSVSKSAGEPDAGQISAAVGHLLEQGHYSRRKLDADLSRQFLKNYLEILDYNHLFFTQEDVDAFTRQYSSALGDDILLANPDPAFEIYDVFMKRVEARIANVKTLLKGHYDFKSNRTIEINRQKSPWPKNDEEADTLWKNRVEGELLQEKLNDTPVESSGSSAKLNETGAKDHAVAEATAGSGEKLLKSGTNAAGTPGLEPEVKIVQHRYDQMLRTLHEQTHDDVLRTFLSTLAQTYDPHSEYLNKSDLENFSINMRLSLVGIGAVLRSEDGYAVIKELVPGGPAAQEGHLKVNDKISAVGQDNHDFQEVVDMKLDKVVDLIRGKKGTTVRLQVIPSHSADPAKRKVVQIVRDEIKLKEQEAKAEIIEREDANGQMKRLGWITLPSFYADMEHSGQKGAKSTTEDVLRLLNRLKQENISGLVMDLRLNGGGSLEEAVNLTGLFTKRGPVVQAKDSTGRITVSHDHDSSVAYDGPMIVLTNRLSASASEIFAAALQDYGRAVIVGDPSTFGKGTVQTMIDIGKVIPFLGSDPTDAGALKLTIQKFYRIAGGSTQLRGVISDIKLPSPTDHPDLGEISLKGPMQYDEVAPVPFDKMTDHPLYVNELRRRSAARVASDREFRYITEGLAEYKQKLAANTISLNEKARREELAEDKARNERLTAERAKRKRPDEKVYDVTLDNVDKPELQLAKLDASPTPAPGAKAGGSKADLLKKAAKAATDDAVKEGATKEGTQNETADPNAAKMVSAPAVTTPDSPAATPDDEDDSDEFGLEGKRPAFDPIRNETLNILRDLVDLSRTPKTASVNK